MLALDSPTPERLGSRILALDSPTPEILGSWILALDSPTPHRLGVVDPSPGQPHTENGLGR